MKEVTHYSKSAAQPLQSIPLFQNASELFVLSRKLSQSIISSKPSVKKTPRLECMMSDFSEQFLRLPILIAEAEVTKDSVKKFKAHQTISNRIYHIYNTWVYIEKNIALPDTLLETLSRKMASLKKSYILWSTLITRSN